MSTEAGEKILTHLIDLTRDVSQGVYDRAGEIFEYTKTGDYPERIAELAEAFGMMIVKVEGREYQLEQIIEELRQKNEETGEHASAGGPFGAYQDASEQVRARVGEKNHRDRARGA